MVSNGWRFAIACAFALAASGHAVAQDAEKRAEETAKKVDEAVKEIKEVAKEAKEAIKKIATSGDDFSGDRLTLRTTVYAFKLKQDPNGADKIAVAGTRLRVISEKDEVLTVAIETIPCKTDHKKDEERAKDSFFQFFGAVAELDCGEFKVGQLVKPGEAYTVLKKTVLDHGYRRSGWVYGALLVPYKYHRHDKSFSSAATIGPYIGYRLDGLGFDSAFIGSIGIASLSVQNNTGGTTTLQGYTTAIGIIANITKNRNPMQFGVMLGRDWAGSNSAIPFQHEGKTWLAVQIGFSFSE